MVSSTLWHFVNQNATVYIYRQSIRKLSLLLTLTNGKNTTTVFNWLKNVENKNQYSFITFNVAHFYPSISLDLLNAALGFASNYDNITGDERHIIVHAKKSCLFSSGKQWCKKSSSDFFNITMGSYDGAESCELVGSFLLHEITMKHSNNFGLDRDDGLGISNKSPHEVELIKKDLCAIFRKYGLKITIEANKKCVDFLDVTLNGKHMPNNTSLYIHSKSNHPTVIIKNLPKSINKHLSDISCDEEAYNRAAPTYQKALDHSGYNHQLKFKHPPPLNVSTSQNKKRHRNVTWYNPPYSENVATNIGRMFLKILDEEFPENHVLHKIFNRNTVKVNYTCMTNVKQTIDGHNKVVLKMNNPDNKTIRQWMQL